MNAEVFMPNTTIDWKNIAGTASEYAIVLIGNKQYTVAKGSKIDCEKLDLNISDELTAKVLLLKTDENITVGKPFVEGTHVQLRVVDQYRDKKVIIFKKIRRHQYQRRKGHRQHYTTLEVISISSK